MIIKKLICTKNSHYFRPVKSISKRGMFVVELENEVAMFDDKKQIFTVDEMFDAICKHREAYLRNKKIETLLN
jgi:hypothetical protein